MTAKEIEGQRRFKCETCGEWRHCRDDLKYATLFNFSPFKEHNVPKNNQEKLTKEVENMRRAMISPTAVHIWLAARNLRAKMIGNDTKDLTVRLSVGGATNHQRLQSTAVKVTLPKHNLFA